MTKIRGCTEREHSFQERVDEFMQECFGPEIAADGVERNHRFLEESLELVQATGMPIEDARMLVEYVYGRPIGEAHQETGGVMVTLAALCSAAGESMDRCGEDELARVWGKIAVIREKQKNKPKGSPLPQYADRPTPSASAPTIALAEVDRLKTLIILAGAIGFSICTALVGIPGEIGGLLGAPQCRDPRN